MLCDSSKDFWWTGPRSLWTNSVWREASSLFKHFGKELGVSYNMLASPEVQTTLENAGFRYMTRSSLTFPFDTHEGLLYAMAVVKQMSLLYWYYPPDNVFTRNWEEDTRKFLAERHQVGGNM